MRPAELSHLDGLKVVALFLSFLLLSAPACLAQSLSEVNDNLPRGQQAEEDLSGSKVTFCSQPLNVNGDHRYFFFVDKANEDEAIELLLTKGQIKFIEPLNPPQSDNGQSQDRVNWQGKTTITVKDTTSFILHTSYQDDAEGISLATDDPQATLAAASNDGDKCAKLAASIAYSNRRAKQEMLIDKIDPVGSLYNLTAELMRLKSRLRAIPCYEKGWKGLKESSILCEPDTYSNQISSEMRDSKLSRVGETITNQHLVETYAQDYRQEFEDIHSRLQLVKRAHRVAHDIGDLDAKARIRRTFHNNYLEFLGEQAISPYRNSFERWKDLRDSGEIQKLSRSYRTLTDMTKLFATEEIWATEDAQLMTLEQILNRKFESTGYRFEITTERPQIDMGKIKTEDGMALLPKTVFSNWRVRNRLQTIPRINIYDETGSLAEADYIFPVRPDFNGMHSRLRSPEFDVPADLEGKLGVIFFDLADTANSGAEITEGLVHESIHSLAEASGYNGYYRGKIKSLYNIKSPFLKTDNLRAKTEYKMMVEGPAMQLAPEIMAEYEQGVKKLAGDSIGSRYRYLDERLTNVPISKQGHNSGYYTSELVMRQAIEDYGLKAVLNHEVDLTEKYSIPDSFQNFRSFAEQHLTLKPQKLKDIADDYKYIYDHIGELIEVIGNEKYGGEFDVDTDFTSADVDFDSGDWKGTYKSNVNQALLLIEWNLEEIEESRQDLGKLSETIDQRFSELNTQLRDFISQIQDRGKIDEGDLGELNNLYIDSLRLYNDLGITASHTLTREFARMDPEEYEVKGEVEGIASRIEESAGKWKQDVEQMQKISSEDVETTSIMETLDRSPDSPLQGKLDDATFKQQIGWQKAKDIALEEFRSIEWSSFAPLFRASAAEGLAQALRDFGNEYDLDWTPLVVGALRLDAFVDMLNLIFILIGPKVYMGLSLIMVGAVKAGLIAIGEAAVYAAGLMLLTSVLIGVIYLILTPLIYLLGMHIMRAIAKARLRFIPDQLRQFKTTRFLLVGMKGLEGYPLGKTIDVELATDQGESEVKSVAANCTLIKNEGQQMEGRKTCIGEFEVPFDPGYHQLNATYEFSQVPSWFGKVASELGKKKGKITLKSNQYATRVDFTENQVCVKAKKNDWYARRHGQPYFAQECAPLSHPISANDYEQTYWLKSSRARVPLGLYKLWVEEGEVKGGLFTIQTNHKLADCDSSQGGVPAGEHLSKQTETKEIMVKAAERGKLRALLKLETEQGRNTSHYFNPSETTILDSTDFIN